MGFVSAPNDVEDFITTGKTELSTVPINPSTSNFDTSGYWGDSGFNFDPTYSDNQPSFGYDSVEIQKVIISGRYEYQLPAWGGFGLVSFQPGSGGGLPLDTDPCVGGAGNKI